MAKADRSITFAVNVDNSKAAKELNDLEKKIEKAKKEVEEKGAEWNAIAEDLKAAKDEAVEAQNAVDKLKAAMEESRAKTSFGAAGQQVNPQEYLAEMAAQSRLLAAAEKRAERLTAQDERALKALEKSEFILNSMETRAGELAAELTSSGSAAEYMAAAAAKAEQRMEKFTDRVKGLAKRMLVFSLITSALRWMKDWFGKVIKTNSEATAAIAKLKGALLTLVQPLVEVVIPAFTTFVNLLTRVVSTVASLMAKLFGTTVEAAAESVQSLYEEQKALDGVGGSAKDAGQSLAGFDEINTISDGSEGSGAAAGSTGIKPDFGFLSEADARLDKIAKSVLLIAAGLGLWKIASGLPGMLGTVATKLAGIAIAVGGLLLLWDGLKDAWENGIDWPNMIEMFAGAAAVVGGLALAFGKVGGGIGLIVSGAAAVITAFHDICENGFNLENVLLAIAGIVATGLGFSLLTGSALPLFIAGIAAVVVEMLALTGHLEEFASNLKENILGGIIQFIKGVFAGDLEGALEGLKKTVKGVVNGVLIIVESFVNLIIKGLNWLIGKINTIKFDVPDWVPLIGGKRLGFNIKTIGNLTLPRLAQGTVVPPNREFLAVLGDNKQETEIVSPLSTMRQAFLEAMRESGGSGQTVEVKLYLDGKQIARNQVKHINDMTQAAGKPVLLF